MKCSFRSICLVVLMLFASVSCTSLMPKDKFNPVEISSIKSVAVVSFTVPIIVIETGSGLLNDLNALIDLTAAVVSDDENKSSGQQIANGATAVSSKPCLHRVTEIFFRSKKYQQMLRSNF